LRHGVDARNLNKRNRQCSRACSRPPAPGAPREITTHPNLAARLQFRRSESQERNENENGNRNKQVLKKEKVMKKVLGVALVAAIMVAALPTTASASIGSLGVTGSKNCVGGSWLRPCRAPMPPSSSGTGRGSSSNGTNRSGSQGNAGTSQGGGKGSLPPAPLGR
jgi:hypothetical protein